MGISTTSSIWPDVAKHRRSRNLTRRLERSRSASHVNEDDVLGRLLTDRPAVEVPVRRSGQVV